MAIAMTFDDGPNSHTTPKLLDLLDKLNLRATFFVLGERVKANPAILKRIASKHEIGNHTWDHKAFACLSDEKIRDELSRTHKLISDTLGVAPKLMRPPYGDISQHQMAWIGKEFSYKIIGWEVDPMDWKSGTTSEAITAHITAHAKDGNTILAHDIHSRTVDAMPKLLPALMKKFTLVTTTGLGKFTHSALAPGKCAHP